MIDYWKSLIWDTAAAEILALSGVRKISADMSLEIPWTDVKAPFLTYQDICYTAAKGRQLHRNYWDLEQVSAAFDKLKSRKGKDHSSVSIQLRGKEKDPRSQGYCMQNMVISMTKDVLTIDTYYRSTELIQKFLADLIFFNEVLPPLFEDLGREPSVMRFKFANVYLSAVFMPIYLRYEEEPLEFFLHLKKRDPRFFRTCGLATRRFFNPEHHYTYRTRVKMHEYWWQYVDQKRVAPLGKLLVGLKGSVADIDEDDE